MHWTEKIAHKILEKHPNRAEYTIASGITPSGSVHIGNFREFCSTYLVGVALQNMGKKVRMIFSWDDFDRMRKVPKIIEGRGFEHYIGKPVCHVPDPFGHAKSYAEHFEREFEKSLAELGMNEIPVQMIYQGHEYQSGRYNKSIVTAVNKRKQIYDILMSFKTQDAEEGERESYYPIAIYCKKCGKDNTKVISYDESTNVIEYSCKCGEVHKMDLKKADNVKLVWKVDWPMRWQAENVIFEMGGSDHSASGGSCDVSPVIAREIFGYEPPVYHGYAFVGIAGGKTKMSSSSGMNITPETLLQIYEPKIIRWLFYKYDPLAQFDFGFDDTIIRHYSEFDAWELQQASQNVGENAQKHQLPISFSLLTTVAPLCSFNRDLVRKVLNLDKSVDLARFDRVKFWLENYAPEKIYKLLNVFNAGFYNTLTTEEKVKVRALHDFLGEERTEKEIQEFLYSIINDPSVEKKQNIETQKRYFKIFYNMLFARDDGPRLYLYLAVARQDCVKLLDPK